MLKVRLLSAPQRLLEAVEAAARSCLSPKPVAPDEVARPGRLARELLLSGHLTTFQHGHLHLVMEGVSRLLAWSRLHSHPFYNSEQVSQRFVKVDGQWVYPPGLDHEARKLLDEAYRLGGEAYTQLVSLLGSGKEALEAARYVLPLGVPTHLHHTVNLVTAMRYVLAEPSEDAPSESRELAQRIEELLAGLDSRIPDLLALFSNDRSAGGGRRASASLGKLPKSGPEVWGREGELGDGISTLLNPPAELRRIFSLSTGGETGPEAVYGRLDQQIMHPEGRALLGVSPSFAVRLSVAADSQLQRHRMVFGARRSLLSQRDFWKCCVVPQQVVSLGGDAEKLLVGAYRRLVELAEELYRLGHAGVACYALPMGVMVRHVESGPLLFLLHRIGLRLCLLAQHEIRRLAWEQARDLVSALPELKPLVGPRCRLRYVAGVSPPCPEGRRFCGRDVWRQGLEDIEPDPVKVVVL